MTEETEKKPLVAELSGQEQLVRHQLNLTYYWQEKQRAGSQGDREKPPRKVSDEENVPSDTSDWAFTRRLNLHSWQRECMDAWFDAGGRGVVKVVTGAGKTILALAILERLREEIGTGLRAVVVVPTIVLMEQWHDILTKLGGLPEKRVARMGGGYNDLLDQEKEILVAVLASASEKLKKATAGVSPDRLVLVVDECHRSGAEKMSRIFEMDRTYSLGLSATPEREDVTENDSEEEDEAGVIDVDTQEEESFEESIIGRELGPIIYELDFAKAIKLGILPTFEVRHYGLPLNPKEKAEYEKVSREITNLRNSLQEQGSIGSGAGGKIVGYARRIAGRKDSPLADTARKFVQLTGDRKRLLYHAEARFSALLKTVERETKVNPGARFLLFHESIEEVMRIFEFLRREGLSAVVEHSQLADSLRRESISLFRHGQANLLVSARSLVEGFDVPSADIGIVVASSSSVRQRIQTLGRILRKHKEGKEEKSARLHVFYMAATTDEYIYARHNWEDFLGAERNLYFKWTPEGESPIAQEGPPRSPLPGEEQVDVQSLRKGETWPGKWEGQELKWDTQGNFRDADGRLLKPNRALSRLIADWNLRTRTLRITPRKKAVLARDDSSGEWKTLYFGILEDMPEFAGAKVEPEKADEVPDPGRMKPGDPWPQLNPDGEPLFIRQKRGETRLARELKNRTVFARTIETAENRSSGEETERVIASMEEAEKVAHLPPLKEITLLPGNILVATAGGQTYFIHQLSTPLEFPE